jgi:hypothetical protein
MRGALLACVLALAVAAGCGEAEETAAPAAPPPTTDLRVRVTGAAGGPVAVSLRCGGGAAACRERRLARLRAALDDATDEKRVCTEVYGGPERAHVTGRLRGERVDVVVARTDGCGIAAYDALFGALGRPAPLATG